MLIKPDETTKTIAIPIPLTKGTEKTRIKKRSFFNEYGLPVYLQRKSHSPKIVM